MQHVMVFCGYTCTSAVAPELFYSSGKDEEANEAIQVQAIVPPTLTIIDPLTVSKVMSATNGACAFD